MIETFALALFWGSLALLAWIEAGFPLTLALRAARPRPAPRRLGTPTVSYIVVVHNERTVIDAKLANVEALAYPRDRLQVIVVSDGSDDGTEARVADHAGPTRVELLALPRMGKNAALNAGVEAADGEILVFSDADSMLEPEALANLVAPFADPSIGGVGGDYLYTAESGEGAGERSHWSLDRLWKRLEGRGGSMTSATGQLYAIRRETFDPAPDGVTDDFFVSTGPLARGLRLHFEPTARASGPVAVTAEDEYRRKVRMMGRGFASVWQRRDLLDPRRTGFYALQLFTHKVMRRLIGVPIVVLLPASVLLADRGPVYAWAFVGQLIFHGLAMAGWQLRTRSIGRLPLVSLPLFVDLVSIAGLLAASDFLRGRQQRSWSPQREKPRAVASTEPR
jgi:glycosyltransferase involved in cell wall biosynthesis